MAIPSFGIDESAPNPAPCRIITIAPNSAEIICELGACDSIIGVDKFTDFPPDLKNRPRIGGLFDPDLERIAALKPDLIVLRGQNDTLERLCGTLGIPLFHDRTETLDDVSKCITELGRLLKRESQAARLMAEFESKIEMVRRRVAGRPEPRVLITISRQPGSFMHTLTAGKGSFLTDTIQLAGGVNVFGHLDMAYPQISPEGIVAQRPEVVIEFMPEIELTDGLKDQLLSEWLRFGPIPAVERGRFYVITDDHCLIPSPRYVEIIEKVSRLIHPELDVERSTAPAGPE